MPYEFLSKEEMKKRYPLINTTDLRHAYYDSFGGYLKARESCQAVVDAFVTEGGKFIQAHVLPGKIQNSNLNSILLSNQQEIKADAFVFACGPWLGQVFKEILGKTITCTKQEVYYFGVPENSAIEFDNFRVWVDVDGENFYYGICNNANRGFKIGIDKRGEAFDPTDGERIISTEILNTARAFIGNRFPQLKDAPLIESRVCPYENSPDGNFVFDVHPKATNLFFLGGGSGHGFKHGPALGELVAKVLRGERTVPQIFSLNRF
jgi:glycine/D-amino acid oxidase-like deaminating enzyme